MKLHLVDWLGRKVRWWWLCLSLPPVPSEMFGFFFEEDSMSHTKKLTVLFPQPRQDEIDFVSDTGTKIVARSFSYSVDGGDNQTVDIPLDQPSMQIGGVPAGKDVFCSLANKTEDGKVGHATTRTFTAPPAPKVIPVPDALDGSFEDEPDPAPDEE